MINSQDERNVGTVVNNNRLKNNIDKINYTSAWSNTRTKGKGTTDYYYSRRMKTVIVNKLGSTQEG